MTTPEDPYMDEKNAIYRNNSMVPVEIYREMKEKLSKEKDTLTIEKNVLSNKLGWIENDVKMYKGKITELEEKLDKNNASAFLKIVAIIILATASWFFYKTGTSERYKQNTAGHQGFLNAENSLRKHLRGMNHSNIETLSCRIRPRNSPCQDNYRFCESSSSRNSSIPTQESLYCCSAGFPSVNLGCEMLPGRITNSVYIEPNGPASITPLSADAGPSLNRLM